MPQTTQRPLTLEGGTTTIDRLGPHAEASAKRAPDNRNPSLEIKEIGMRNGLTRGALLVLSACLLAVVGCASDEQQRAIGGVLGVLDKATTKVSQVRKHLQGESLPETEKSKGGVIKETSQEVIKATAAAKELREVGDLLQRWYTEVLKVKTSNEYAAQLAERSRPKLEEKILAFEKERNELEVVLAQAETRADVGGKRALKILRDRLKEGYDSFAVLAKVQ
jgi:hypothetical protein